MDFSQIEDFTYSCRGCLNNEGALVLHSLLDEQVRELFTGCTTIEIDEEENLPIYLCSQCFGKCESWQTFKMTCLSNDSTLRTMLTHPEDIKDDQEVIHMDLIKREPSPTADQLYEVEQIEDSDLERILNEEDDFIDPVVKDEDYNAIEEEPNDEDDHEMILEEDQDMIHVESYIQVGSDILIQCQFCNEEFSNISLFEFHFKVHKDETDFRCKCCKASFKTKFRFKNHMYEHSNYAINCKECSREFKTPDSYKKHMRTAHNDEQQFFCDQCGKVLKSKSCLNSHLASHSDSKPFACDICGTRFKHRENLNQHLKRHNGVKNFTCSECNKSFFLQSELNNHTRRNHTNIRPCVCEVCGKGFMNPSLLQIHSRKHTGEKPYECESCGKRFARSKEMKDHILIHTGEKPHECPLCHRFFRKKNTLKVHLRTHSKD